MKPPEYKLIDPKDMKPGDQFEGYEGHTNSNGTRTSHFVRIEVGEDGIARERGAILQTWIRLHISGKL